MAKRLFLLIIGGLIGIICNSNWLAATDVVMLAGLDSDSVVETVPLPEPEPEEILAPSAGQIYAAPFYTEPVYAAPADSIQINGRTIALNYTDTTTENAGAVTVAWYYSSGKFIYGHNSGNVFGFLDAAYDGGWLNGMNFTVNMNGEMRSYTVVNYRLYDYAGEYALAYEGNNYGMRPIERAELLDVPTHSTTSYNMAIMTCYDGSSKRLVVFAN